MKIIDLCFDVQGEPLLCDEVVAEIKQHYNPIPPMKLDQLWGNVPHRVKLSIEVAGVCISLFDDWICTLFGNSYSDCLVALCAFHNLLVSDLGKKVTFSIIQPTSGVDKLIRGQRWKRRLTRIWWILLGVAIAVAVKYIFEWLQGIFQQRGAS